MPSTLTVAGGPQDGQSLSVDQGATHVIGSAPGSALTVALGNVAPAHARVSLDPGRGLLISDLDSATGTYVNGERIGIDHVLADGDRVCLGPPGSKQTVKLVVRVEAETGVEPALILDPPTETPFVLEASPVMTAPEPAIILDDEAPEAPPAAVKPPPLPGGPATPARLDAPKPVGAAPADRPAAEARKTRAEYTTEQPSIEAPDRPREAMPPPLPAAELLKKARKAPGPRALLGSVPRPLLAVGVGLLLSAIGYFGWSATQAAPPILNAVLPPRAEAGQTVSLQGSGFGTSASAVTVRFGDQAGEIVSATDTQVAVALPQIVPPAGAADFPVTIESRAGRSNAIFLTIAAPPRITAFSPDVAMPGDTVRVEGKNLDGKQLTVLVSGQPAEVVGQKPGELSFRVPQLPVSPGDAAMVVVQAGRESSKSMPLYLGRLPLVIEARPLKAMAGDRVTLKGRGFDSNPANLTITFGSQPALVLSAADNELVASVPGSGIITSQMEAPIVVSVRGSRSNTSPFFLTRPSSGYYVPHYFAAPVPDHPGYALVATDLGPVLALGSAAEAPTTAERAARAAAALNAMVDQAQTRPVTLEVRDRPVLGVAIAGQAELLVSVTGDDLAAYGALDPTLRGRRVSQRGLAAFWVALLQDQLSLFVTRERPFRVVEITTRGRALMQIYSEALRRAGAGGGVPVGVVSPLPSTLARDLQEMALVLPTDGQSSPAAALEGRWVGTMWDEGRGDKAIAIRLYLDGSRLQGTLTTSAGKVGADIPLEDLAYDKGQLRFILAVGGLRRQFRGDVQGATMTGEVAPAGSGAKGRFTLKYAQ
jgi:FHA domain/IPT/TIG domain